MAAGRKGGLERRCEQLHMRRGGTSAHNPDAPDLAGQGAHARTDLDVERLAQLATDRGFVDAIGRSPR